MAENLEAAFAAARDRLRLAFQTIGSAVGSIADWIIQGVHYLYEISTKRLVSRLLSGSNSKLHAAAFFLERADCTLSQLPPVDEAGGSDVESYEAVSAMHDAVGALEEVACQVAGTPTSTLPKALKKLVRRGMITRGQSAPMNSVYVLRNETRGVGHGADAAPNVIARAVMWQVRAGIFVLLNAAGIGSIASAPGSGIAYRSGAALATGGA